jgi:selenocysteine lyase/cysteine desulfurase
VTDLAAFRKQFPALERVTYLNNATAAPGSIPVLDALRRVEGEWEAGEFSWQAWETEGEATRELFAGLVGGRGQDVALLPTVAEAAATVAGSLPRGRVVVGEREFTSNLFPWLALRDRGFDVVEVPAADGATRTEALVEVITDGTVLVAVTEVQSSNGFRVHVDEIGRRCREVGARLFVDGCQSLGALRLDAPNAGVVLHEVSPPVGRARVRAWASRHSVNISGRRASWKGPERANSSRAASLPTAV